MIDRGDAERRDASKLLRFFLPEKALDPRAEESETVARRRRLLLVVLLLCGANLFLTYVIHTLLGNFELARTFALLIPVAALLLIALRMGVSLALLAHTTVSAIYAVSLYVALSTGDQIAGGLFFLVLVPAIAILVTGRSGGVAWAIGTVATLVVIGASSGPDGIQPWVVLEDFDRGSANLRAAGVVLLAVTAVTYFLSRIHERAQSDLEALVSVHQNEERRFRAISEHAYDLISEVDLSGRFLFVSPGFEEVLGWNTQELIGVLAVDRLHPEDYARAEASWVMLREKGAVRQEPVRLLSAAGGSRWFEISMRAYTTTEGETRIVTVSRDVTERLEREKLLRRQDRLIAGGAMAAGAVHQLKNPLASIMAAAQYANMFKWNPSFGDLAGDSLDAIESEAMRSSRILDAMLSFVREETGERWVEDLKNVLFRAVRVVQSEERESETEIVMSLTRETVRVLMNPIEIEQVTINLIRNAIEAGAHLVVIGLDLRPGRVAQITISDDGPGLGTMTTVDAFSPFSTSRPGVGTGLGLPVAREIVQAHGGEIFFDESNENGTVLKVDLPLAEA